MSYAGAFQPVRRYALVRMRKPRGADDKHGADECVWENLVALLKILSLFNRTIFFLQNMGSLTRKHRETLRSYFDSLIISTEQYIRSYGKLLRNFLSACSVVASWWKQKIFICMAKLSWYQFFAAPPIAQDQRSYSICVLSQEHAGDPSSDVCCSVA